MNSKTTILIIISVFTSLISCHKKTVDYCKNEIELIAPDNEHIVIDFKLTDDPESVRNTLDSELHLICDMENSYGFRLEDIAIKTYTVKACHTTYLHKMFAIDITLNENGKVLMQTSIHQKVFEIGNISDWFAKNYPLKKPQQLNKIRLSWAQGISSEQLNTVIKEIIKGYLKSVDKISTQEFKKNVCKLSESELHKLKKLLPFEFELRNYSRLEIRE